MFNSLQQILKMKIDLQKIFDLFEVEEDRRFEENQLHPETMFIDRRKNKFKLYHDTFVNKVNNHQFGTTTETGENLDAMKKFDISIDEASLIYMYTIDICFSVNDKLRSNSNDIDKDILEYCKQLNWVLQKLPSYDNDIVYRDIRSPLADIETIFDFYEKNLNNVITEKAFMSSHIEKQYWRNTDSDFGLQIHTKTRSNGKDLRELSFNSNEQEVLFQTNTQLLIQKIDKETNTIFVKEI